MNVIVVVLPTEAPLPASGPGDYSGGGLGVLVFEVPFPGRRLLSPRVTPAWGAAQLGWGRGPTAANQSQATVGRGGKSAPHPAHFPLNCWNAGW